MRITNVLQGFRRRLAMTGKRGRQFYKGTRTGNVGRITKHGKFIVNWDKVRTYVVPAGLEACTLRPLVSRNVKPVHGDFPDSQGPISGRTYLERWKSESDETMQPLEAATKAPQVE